MILLSLGFPSFPARFFRLFAKFPLKLLRLVVDPKIRLLCLVKLFSIDASFPEISNCLGLLFFSGALIVRILLFMSVHSSAQASPDLAIVSFTTWRKTAVFPLHPAMSWSISVSVGMKGILLHGERGLKNITILMRRARLEQKRGDLRNNVG